ncbi:MAG: sulfite exporter TauE/SafE family protein [Fibrobacteria bacterium]|nr:sulfite exporter TauE/SafE family protein [Fibrobacteria bacterium]
MCPFFHYTWLSSSLFLLSGISLGALGAGGSLIALPVFVHVLGLPMDLAVPATAGTMAIASLSGAWDSWRKGKLDIPVAIRFGVPGLILSFAGSFLTPRIPGDVLTGLFIGLLTIAGVRLFLPEAPLSRTPNLRSWRLPLAGGATGFLTGLLAIGGGFLSTPALILEAGLTASAAAPISLLSMAANSSASLVGHVLQGNFRWTLVLPALVAVLLGMELGTLIGSRLSHRVLRSVLGVVVLSVGAFTLWTTWLS